MVKFISYDGAYPNLCRGTLNLDIDGELVSLANILETGGYCRFVGDDWSADVGHGPWTLSDLPEEYKKYQSEILQVVNENINWGCCGGCL